MNPVQTIRPPRLFLSLPVSVFADLGEDSRNTPVSAFCPAIGFSNAPPRAFLFY